MTDIHTILQDPRYREFAVAVTACGRQVIPDGYPWCHMGLSVEEFLALDLYHEDMSPMDQYEKEEQLGVLRAQEKLVCEAWDWWLGWDWLQKDKGAAAIAPPASVPSLGQGLLF
jgi:hypothetical protein